MKKIATLLGGMALAALTGMASTPENLTKGVEQLPADAPLDNHVHLYEVGARVRVPSRAPEGGYTVPVTFTPTQEQFNETLILNNNNDDSTWGLAENAYRYRYNTKNAADDWAILPAVKMDAGVYKLTATYYTKSNPESFAIKLGNERTPEAMTTTLLEKVDYSNTTAVTESFPFEITAEGDYYVGLYAFSQKNQYYLFIKNIIIEKVDESLPKPVTINSVTSVGYDVTVNYTVPTQTVGGVDITEDLAVAFTVDGEAQGEAVVAAPGATLDRLMTLTSGNHTIGVTAALGEKISEPSTYSLKVTKIMPVPLPIPLYLAPDEDEFSWCKVYNVNDDTSTWVYSTSGDSEQSPTFRYSYNYTKDADDWIITPAIGCEKGKVYELSFKVSTKYNDEGLEAAVGYGDQPSDMAITVYKDEALKTNDVFVVKSGKFLASEDGYMHLGFHAISLKNRSFIYVKEISIVEVDGGQPVQPEMAASFDGGDGTVTVTAPSANIGGNDLAGDVTLALYIDSELKGTATVAPGASHDFDITGLALGKHALKATASVTVNDEVIVSEPVEAEIAIGRPSSFAYEVPVTFAMNADDFSDYLVIDVNNDKSTWEAAPALSDGIRYKYSGSNAADDWLITEAIALKPGITYTLSLDMRGQSASYNEQLEIFVGNARTVEAMTQMVYENTEINFAAFENKSADFSVETEGKYFVGLHAKSEKNKYYIFVKNLTITAPAPGSPAAVTDFDVDPDPTGLYKATVYFTMPTLARDGSALVAEESLTATVEGSNTQVVEGLPGQEMEVEIETVKGESIVTVTPSNSEGKGIASSMEVVCGLANPSKPNVLSVKVSDDNMSVTIEWAAVVTGTSPGVVNPAAMRYRIFEWDENDEDWYLIDDVADTHFTVTLDEGAPLQAYTVGIDAYNSVSTSSSMTQLNFVLGTPYTMPMDETFAGNKLNYTPLMFSSTYSEEVAPKWKFAAASSVVEAAGQVPALIGSTTMSAGNSRLLFPKVSTVGSDNVIFSVKVWVDANTPKYTALVANANSTEYTILGECDLADLSGWQEFKFRLPADMVACQWVSPVLFCEFKSSSEKAIVGGYAVMADKQSGIDEVIATEGADTEAVYYNLQGIRVDHPSTGTLYIKHQGSTATKVIVK